MAAYVFTLSSERAVFQEFGMSDYSGHAVTSKSLLAGLILSGMVEPVLDPPDAVAENAVVCRTK